MAILPYIEQNDLYQQFKLDEPWDSDHNKKLIEKIPKIYMPLNGVKTEKGNTFYQIFVGREAMQPGMTLLSFTDGASNTLMIAESGDSVPWTRPDDMVYDSKKPLPKLGGLFGGNFNAAFMDGSVRYIRKTIPEKVLRKSVDHAPAGGEVNRLGLLGQVGAKGKKQMAMAAGLTDLVWNVSQSRCWIRCECWNSGESSSASLGVLAGFARIQHSHPIQPIRTPHAQHPAGKPSPLVRSLACCCWDQWVIIADCRVSGLGIGRLCVRQTAQSRVLSRLPPPNKEAAGNQGPCVTCHRLSIQVPAGLVSFIYFGWSLIGPFVVFFGQGHIAAANGATCRSPRKVTKGITDAKPA